MRATPYEIREEEPSEFARSIGVTRWFSVFDAGTGRRLAFARYRTREDAEIRLAYAQRQDSPARHATIYARAGNGELIELGWTETPAELGGLTVASLLRAIADEYEATAEGEVTP